MSGPRMGLVLGGGGARGAFTAGVVSYLRYNNVRKFRDFPVVSGTSTGALVGTMVCLKLFAKLEKIYTTVTTADIVNPNQSLIANVFGLEAATFASVLFGDTAVFSAEALERLIDKNVDFTKVKDRADVSRLLLNTIDLQTGEIRVYDNKKHGATTLKKALLASASEPVFMPPIDIRVGGEMLQHVDGGVRELVPLGAAFRSGIPLDVIVVVLTNPVEPSQEKRLDGILKILARTIDLTLSDVGMNDIRVARQINALVRIQENLAKENDPALVNRILDGVDPGVLGDVADKRSVELIVVAPAERLDVNSLDFDPAVMQTMFDQGWDRGVDVLEPFLDRWDASLT